MKSSLSFGAPLPLATREQSRGGALAAAALVFFGFVGTGCAEEEAEGPEVAYPVGMTAPARQARYEVALPAPAPQAPVAEPQSPEVVIGADSEDGTALVAPGPEETSGTVVASTNATPDDAAPSALTDFRATLDPYGSWVDDSTYGTVWVPSSSTVGADFAPYVTAGHWAYDDDYTWVSDYSWGWAPFHYGRWVYVAGLGWEWIPGRAYSGAWVSWRYGLNDWAYVGWAPLAPTWCWRRGVAVGIGFAPRAPYAFVGSGDLFAPRLRERVIAGDRAGFIAAHTRPWVAASPALGGRVMARPSVGGPPPSALRIPQSAVAHVGSNMGVWQARAFGGGPAQAAVASGPGFVAGTGGAARSVAPAYRVPAYGAPAYGAAAPAHFGGRFGTGFIGRAPSSAPMQSGARPYYAAPSAPSSPRPYFGAPSAPRAPAPSYHVGAAASPSFGTARIPSAPAFRGFSGGATGGVHTGGGFSGFHGGGGGGGGGFRGGGGGRAGGHR